MASLSLTIPPDKPMISEFSFSVTACLAIISSVIQLTASSYDCPISSLNRPADKTLLREFSVIVKLSPLSR